MTNPIALFSEWFEEVRAHPSIVEPTAMTLATATCAGIPSARVVLLKFHDERGFVFFTNMQSRKSLEIQQNPHVALCFNWIALDRQVRVEGKAQRVSEEEADRYFNRRPLISRIGAIASDQSRPLDARQTLVSKVEALKKRYSEADPPPRPPHWSGWRVAPEVIEFWQQGEFRLHDRELYTRDGGGWVVSRLYP